ncbi:DELLA protein RGL1-like [Punica granatum]|uniref:DELLA protein RGL1-like n=1 Tax=Punica granatum TaxID=22663 RepID=A0A6P8C6T1_PUNGR|nr:DELLA protein RGL1-like [Punica granatum]
MERFMFPPDELNLKKVMDELNSFNRSDESYELEGQGDFDSNFHSLPDYGFSNFMEEDYQQSPDSDHGLLNNLRLDMASPPIHTCLEEIAKLERITNEDLKRGKHKNPPSLASLELLKSHGTGFKKLTGERIIEATCPVQIRPDRVRLSVIEIMRIAGVKLVHSASKMNEDNPSDIPGHRYGHHCSDLTGIEVKNVHLAENLMNAVEKVSNEQFENASSLLDEIDQLCSYTGEPVERIVYYFSEALREKIDRETGQTSDKGLGKKLTIDLDKVIMGPTSQMLACHRRIPFSQILQFSGVQVIIDHVMDARRVHIIDLGIRNGCHWTVLMQALASRRHEPPLELVKITAITTCLEKDIAETGKRLESFAKTLDLPFSYKVIMLLDMLDLKEDVFDLGEEEKESVVVYADFLLKTMISKPDRLEWLMKVLKSINPCVVVINEVESNHNSPNFVNRFVESLFYYSAYFDSLDECMEDGDDGQNRRMTESDLFGQAIRRILAAEGEERNIRHVKIAVWRAFFTRFGMEEVDLGMASLYQAELVVRRFPCRSSCTLDLDGKSLIIRWKGIPIHSLSAWKFQQPEEEKYDDSHL